LNTTILEVGDVSKVFHVKRAGIVDDLVAVDGVSFSIEQGRCLAIVGESGSGKSTIARMVAGLEKPTTGTIVVGGKPRGQLPWPRADRRTFARQVQMVFQDPNSSLNPSQTIEDSLLEVLRFHHPERDGSWRQKRISELLEQVGLHERHRAVRPRRLSGGEKQRAAISRALAAEPQLLILDEAVSALDVSVQALVLNLLTELRSRLGLTYLFISHDLGVVRQVSDDAIVMRQGVVVERGATQAILDDPEHEYTRALQDAVPRPGWKPARRSL